MELTPFALSTAHLADHLHLDGLDDLALRPIEDPAQAGFARVLNWSNQLAFGGETNMGMPPWVMLDCGILSGAIVGFSAPREALSPALQDALRLDELAPELEMIPVSEYCACPTLEPGCVSGFSLQALIEGRGLGLRTKALALAVLGAQAQLGVTQFHNRAIRVHARFGPMRLLIHQPSVHTHADDSFVYKLELPPRAALLEMAQGTRRQADQASPRGSARRFDPDDASDQRALAAHLRAGRKAWIVAPGWHQVGPGGCALEMIWSEA